MAVSAVRGHAISFRADPFFDDNTLVDIEDAKRRLGVETRAVEAGVSPAQNLEEARLSVLHAETCDYAFRPGIISCRRYPINVIKVVEEKPPTVS